MSLTQLKRILFTILAVLAVVFFSSGVSDFVKNGTFQVVRPIRLVFSWAVDGVTGMFTSAKNLKNAYKDNEVLRKQVANYQSELAQAQDKLSGYETLQKEVGLKTERNINPVACNVLHLDLDAETLTATLDCGTQTGVAVGQVGVSGDYVAGKIIYAGNSTSTLMLAISSQFAMDVRLARSGTETVAKGSYNSGLLLDLVPKNEELKQGDLVVAAGLSDPRIKGILVGTVSDIVSDPAELFQRAAIQSPVKFKSLDHILVLP